MFNVRLSLVAFILLWNASDVFCSHFRGGIITWKPDPHNPLKVVLISFFSINNAKSRLALTILHTYRSSSISRSPGLGEIVMAETATIEWLPADSSFLEDSGSVETAPAADKLWARRITTAQASACRTIGPRARTLLNTHSHQRDGTMSGK